MEPQEHDLLIRIDTRLERLERDFRESQLGFVKDLAALEVRLRIQEDIRAKYDPAVIVPEFREVQQGWRDFSIRLRTWGAVGVVVAAALSNLLRLYVLPLFGIKP